MTRTSLLASLIVVAGLALAGPARGASWTTFGHDTERTSFDPDETLLDAGVAARLREAWSVPVGAIVDAQPSYVPDVATADGRRADLVLVGTEAGRLLALDAADGAIVWAQDLGHQVTTCPDLPDGIFGISAPAVVDAAAARVYAAGGDDRIHALDLATGAEAPGWPVSLGARPRTDHVWGALNLFRGRIYAATASYCDNAFYRGALVAVDVARSRRVARRWLTRPHVHGGGIWGWGGVAIDSATGRVYGATANAQTRPQDADLAEHVLRLTPGLRVEAKHRPRVRRLGDADFGAHPVLLRGAGCPPQLAVVHKSGTLLLYDRDRLASGPRQRLQLADQESQDMFGTYAWSPPDRRLYVNLTSGHGRYRAGVVALGLGANCRLKLAWQAPAGDEHELRSVPVVAAGVVWAGAGARVYALATADGRRLWDSGETLGNIAPAAPVPADGRLFVAAWDGRLHAYMAS